jgi:pimeloyl-ACP methyl ester carboxylesterase
VAAPAADRSVDRVVRDVTARGVRMRVLVAGEGNGPALVLVHDFLVSHLQFDDVIDTLAERFHVIAPDLPGFGESEKPSPARYAYGIETFTEAVADLIAAFGVGRAHVVGQSMGAAVAITLAAEHPELVQRLVLEDALCYPFPMTLGMRLPLLPVVGGILFKQLYGRGMFRKTFRETVFRADAAVPLSRIDRYYDLFNAPSARESAHAVLRAVLDARPVVARLTRITAPTLVVWGRDDSILPVAGAQRLAREIPGAKLEIMDAGHSPHEERPEEFVALVTQFLEGKR